jgi:hypothetical protein
MGQSDSTRTAHAASAAEPVEPPAVHTPGEAPEKNWELAWIDLGGEG